MKRLIWIFVLLFGGCAMPNPKSYREYNLLSSQEIKAVTSAANKGDVIACLRLYRHFYIGLGEFSKGEFWLKKGAQLGDEKCLKILKSISTR